MRELNLQEMKNVNGGFYQALLPVAVGFATRFVTSKLAKHFIGNFSLSYGTYQAAVGLDSRVR
ncbi:MULTISPECIES: hypothetical protein [Microbulbifer]|uniref:hypothetical protein n=1 Tax=Microbulbifer TaxID=48073 RepID=UPI001E5DC95C|nr:MULTISPECIES: hypothetical protein [Microbulbifer]UHQ53862.1 hypothetical protein LVE68_10080 [Microbulbifer sp. YPW16]